MKTLFQKVASQAFAMALLVSWFAAQPSPAAINLTTANSSWSAADGTFSVRQGNDGGAAGTGVFDSFVRIQMRGNEQGYNTSNRPVNFNELTDPNFTRAIRMADIAVVQIGNYLYREFRLDINENNSTSGRLLSLNQIQIFTGPNDPLAPANLLAAGVGQPSVIDFGLSFHEVFRLNEHSGVDFKEIKLNSSLTAGSGRADMFLYVRNDLFGAGNQNVILYSQFGTPPGSDASDAGFEEWGVRHGGGPVNGPVPPVPEPTTLAIWGLGLGIAGLVKLRRNKLAA